MTQLPESVEDVPPPDPAQPEPATEAIHSIATVRDSIVRLAGQRNDYKSQAAALRRQTSRLQRRVEELTAENNFLRAQVSQHAFAP